MSSQFNVELAADGRQFTVAHGETLLEAGLRSGIPLAYQCKAGSCGQCKGKVLSGTTRQTAPATGLSAQEHDDGFRLLCCSTALEDLTIACRLVEGMPGFEIRKMPLRVIEMDQLADDVMRIRAQPPAGQVLNFIPGQFLDVLLPGGARRSYSFATPANAQPWIELHIRHMPGGLFTDVVHGKMKPRDLLRVEGPFGRFFLNPDATGPVILLASGTGFAPIKAIMENVFNSGIKRKFALYWGGRSRKDIYHHALCRQWEKDYPGIFSFTPVLSAALPEDEWQGRTGYVHQAVMADYPQLAGHEVYACGAPAMVEAAKKAFIEDRRLSPASFFSDAFISQADRNPAPARN